MRCQNHSSRDCVFNVARVGESLIENSGEAAIWVWGRSAGVTVKAAITVDGSKKWMAILGIVHVYQGLYERGLQEVRLGAGEPPSQNDLPWLAFALGRAGRKREALEIIEQLERTPNADAVWVAIAWTGIGNKDKAFEWLNRALEVHSASELWIGVFPCLDPLRSDARFKEVLRRTGLPQ